MYLHARLLLAISSRTHSQAARECGIHIDLHVCCHKKYQVDTIYPLLDIKKSGYYLKGERGAREILDVSL